jgi:hypothetical protein
MRRIFPTGTHPKAVILSRRSRESRSDGTAEDGEGSQDARAKMKPAVVHNACEALHGFQPVTGSWRSFAVLRRFRASRSTASAAQDDKDA